MKGVIFVSFLDYDTSGEDRLLMLYRPPLRLCARAEGFTQGAATRNGEEGVALQPPAACIAVTTSASLRDRSPCVGSDHARHGRC